MKDRSDYGLRSALTLCVVAVLCLAMVDRAWANSRPAEYVAGTLLVQSRAGVSASEMHELLDLHGAITVHELKQLRVREIKVPEQALEKVKAALAKNPHISYAENNFIAASGFEPDDYQYPSQWHLPKISAPEGWDMSIGSESIPVAIIDSGVDPNHQDLWEKLIPGYNFIDENTDTHDVYGHGTAVAGTAAAVTNNFVGVAGVAWENPIMPLMVLNSDNRATYYDIARAITHAADQGIRVINISLGGSSSSSTLQNAVNYAWNKGAVIFACAMNNSSTTPYYPAACSHVIAVSATTSADTLASFSNYGNWIDISAPGASILTTKMGGGYGSRNGTSFSSPIAAGLAALILSANPCLTNDQVVDIITQNADDLGEPGFDTYYGYGRVNLFSSLVAATETVTAPDLTAPYVSIISPEDGATISDSTTVNVSATDDVGVERLEIYVNGVLIATDTTAPYGFYWDTTNYSEGYYELSALAYDYSQNEGQSNVITVYVTNTTPEDTTPPHVSITSPEDGATISDSTTVNVSATDDVGVERLEIYVNGVLIATDTTAPYGFYWDTTNYSEGYYELSALAYDYSQNEGQSNVITVYVTNTTPEDTTPPHVSITSPEDGASVSDRVIIRVSASDSSGISKLELYIDGRLKVSKPKSILTYRWNVRKTAKGAHTISAKAYDTAGNVGAYSITAYHE